MSFSSQVTFLTISVQRSSLSSDPGPVVLHCSEFLLHVESSELKTLLSPVTRLRNPADQMGFESRHITDETTSSTSSWHPHPSQDNPHKHYPRATKIIHKPTTCPAKSSSTITAHPPPTRLSLSLLQTCPRQPQGSSSVRLAAQFLRSDYTTWNPTLSCYNLSKCMTR